MWAFLRVWQKHTSSPTGQTLSRGKNDLVNTCWCYAYIQSLRWGQLGWRLIECPFWDVPFPMCNWCKYCIYTHTHLKKCFIFSVSAKFWVHVSISTQVSKRISFTDTLTKKVEQFLNMWEDKAHLYHLKSCCSGWDEMYLWYVQNAIEIG